MRIYLCPKKNNDVKAQVEKLKQLSLPAPSSDFPAISVIIPLYNVEKYVAECLDSILAQTFQNFEVIVVDDCSTDSSVEIVKSYSTKFDGRLTIVRTKKNSGYAGFPRNKGIELARGEYLYFVDPDDTITPTALEELYTAAKYYNADVVHCEKYYFVPDEFYNDAEYRKTLKPYSWPSEEKIYITQPTLLTNDFERRIRDFSQRTLTWSCWVQLIRRDLLIDNEIRFLSVCKQDIIFTMCELCCAKNYLIVPNVVYYYRVREDSITKEKLEMSPAIHRYTSALKQGISYLDEFLNRREFFVNRPDLKYALFDILTLLMLWGLNEIYRELPPYELNELLKKEFDDSAAVKAYFFNKMNLYRLQLNPPQETITAPTVEILPASSKKDFTPKKFPAISVIIPMYNVEKYVGECLDSLLAQTFQSFEVIVVDDCSTDKSVDIVRSYAQKFNGRLTLTKTEKNSGGCAVPRNVGFPLAGGEYVYFFDADDTVTPTALEELYTAAKKYNADVVHCEKYWRVPDEFYNDAEYKKNLKPFSYTTAEKTYITQPTMLTSDLEKRITDFNKNWLIWNVWVQLVRRDFLLKNRISFANIYPEDLVFTMCELCCAKKYVLIPNVIIFYRSRKESLVRKSLDLPQMIHRYATALKCGISYLEEFLNRQEFFAARPDLKYALFDNLGCKMMNYLNEIYHEVPVHTFDEHLRKEFDSDGAFAAFIFNTMNIYRLKLNPSPRRIVVPPINIDRIGDRAHDFLSKKIPAVSVIIPLYNSEKYIGELLESILAQTFQDFEVIVVDDCSTDLSAEVVKIYAPLFSGRLKLVKTKKNTGTPGEPGNLGVSLSHGKYLFILDNDDAITPDAIEKLYNIAENFDADVVACQKYYKLPEESQNDPEFRKNIKPFSWLKDFVTKPTLLPSNVKSRIQYCHERKFLWELWSKLIRRDVLIENGIHFITSLIQDMMATSCLLYTAKRFLLVPYVVNYYRVRKSSLYRQEREPIEIMKLYLNTLNVGFKYLDGFLNGIEFFRQNPESKNLALKTYFNETWGIYIKPIYNKIPIHEREDALIKEFGGSDNTNLVAFLFNELGNFKESHEGDIQQFIPSPLARVDLKMSPRSSDSDFQILSVSDAKAEISKPHWLQKDSTGYLIQSYENHIEIIAKASAYGKIRLDLRGLSVFDPKDKTKRLPYWVEYTNLTVNGKTVFNTSTVVWHDKPYNYTFDAKAGEEIKIQTDWLPRQSNVLTTFVKKDEVIVNKKFSPYFTGRVDLKLKSKNENGDFQIVGVSDKQAEVIKAEWLPKNELGYVIQSRKGNVEIIAKAGTDGKFILGLKGLYVRDPNDDSKRIPYWIDYTKLVVNGKIIFDKITPAWHDKPYNYTLDVKAGEEIKIQTEWLPHSADTSNVSADVAKIQENNTAKIFVRRTDKKTEPENLQLLSVSDSTAKISEPDWWQQFGICHVIDSRAGNVEITAKAVASGQVQIQLAGPYALNPKDKSKRLPCWIDYTKLVVNGKTIFNQITPAWHDKAYICNIEVKAGEELKIQVEWLPHLDNRDDLSAKVAPPQEPQKILEPPKVQEPKNYNETIRELSDHSTARADIQLVPKTKGDFQIISVSDGKADIRKPAWLQKNGIGYQIQSYAGRLEFIAKSSVDGKINLRLRGLDVRSPEDKNKKIPHWIDYTKLIVNGKIIFDEITPAWLEKFYSYNTDIKAGEEIKIQIEWLPHGNN